ncbi:MAG TPA: flagellar hook-basal body complex protein FliE [Nocardioidaceae bacterium]|jgi:flagellar hook-basal body complex protein FliE|nr:flagellar hook-basal body complex protein FliE [Nocardioidaceae bacterium]
MSVPGIEGFVPLTPATLAPQLPIPPTAGPGTAAGVSGIAGTTGVGGIGGIGGAGAVGGVQGTGAVSGAAGPDFGQLLSDGLQRLQGLHTQADQLAVQAATGDLDALHDYTITATEAAVSTQLTTAVRNKALEAFQEIMRMAI